MILRIGRQMKYFCNGYCYHGVYGKNDTYFYNTANSIKLVDKHTVLGAINVSRNLFALLLMSSSEVAES